MKVVTSEEMRKIDRETIERYGIPGVVLMERAGLSVASLIKQKFNKCRVIVISGSGNNGGDGFVVARNLYNEGWDVKVFLTKEPKDLKGDALLQYKIAVNFGLDVRPIKEFIMNHSALIKHHSIIVDAILGTGLSKNITGVLSDVINIINISGRPVISVDIPSGISTDNGQILGVAVKADYTVTFGLPKRGHLLYPGAEYTGRLFVENIGFHTNLIDSDKLKVELIDKERIKSLIPKRQKYSHKGKYGHVLIVAGSKGKTGAAVMAAKACLRTGAGLVTLGVPESLADIFQSHVVEEMTLILPDKGDGTLSKRASKKILDYLNDRCDIFAIGPGIGVSQDIKIIISNIIINSPCPVVIDADGLNSISEERDIFKKAKVPVILTPHPGEMSRLLKIKNEKPYLRRRNISIIKNLEQDRINTASVFATETKTYLVLKGVPTIIAAPDGKTFINSTGNPGMATGGTGDVLTGMIAGFLGQVKDPLKACILGVFMHGLAGDIAASEKGVHSMIATEIISKIPDAFLSMIG